MKKILRTIGPGLMVAATGVGASDLATAAFSGSKLGLAILWVVVVGAAFKYILNEGLMRYQLATDDTLLEGGLSYYGKFIRTSFLIYFCIWSFLVAGALMSAIGVVTYAILPLGMTPETAKVVYGIVQSLIALIIIYLGNYEVFEKIMNTAISVMFVAVVVIAAALVEDWGEVAKGLVVPRIPQLEGEGLPWTLALMGGVGGTLTVLNYGYWIREKGRQGEEALTICRIDLRVAYAMTALFGIAMVIIGNRITVEGGGAMLIVRIGEQLDTYLHPVFKWVFLLGSWGAVFSSLLGVWQGVPYLFADIWEQMQPHDQKALETVSTESKVYRYFLIALAVVPMISLGIGFARLQQLYAIVGALFMPMLAITLLLLNFRDKRIGERLRNTNLLNLVLIIILAFFTGMLGWKVYGMI